jgi:CDP-glucose 4,6-dehydratase
MKLLDMKFWKDKKVFVTGGTGFIGSHLVSKLISLGANVKLFVHHIQPQIDDTYGYRGDLTYGYVHYTNYMLDFAPDIIFHLAAQPIVSTAMEKELQTAEINIKGTYYFLHACKEVSSIKSILHVSTDKVYGKVEDIQSDSPLLGSAHPYNATKLCGDIMAQMYAEAYDMPITIVRNGNIYGPGDLHWDRVIPGTIKQIFNKERPVCRGGSRDYIYVSDIVYGYLRLVEERYGKTGLETVNLGAEQPTDTLQVIDMIVVFMSTKYIDIIKSPMWKGELVNQHINNNKAKQLIDWCPDIPLDKGLSATVKWYEAYLRQEKKNEQT